MAGKHKGVQARIKAISPEAHLVPFEEVKRREINSCLDRVLRLREHPDSNSYGIHVKHSLEPATLLKYAAACGLTHYPCDIDREEFVDGEHLGLLQFIGSDALEVSVPNIVLWLRICLIVAMSSAGCERNFSNLELIKNYLRSSMSHSRLSNPAAMSIEIISFILL